MKKVFEKTFSYNRKEGRKGHEEDTEISWLKANEVAKDSGIDGP